MAQVVIIGGDAAGGTVASNLRRLLPSEHEVVVLERTDRTSYSACGIPYWISGDVDSADDLVARTPEEHRANGVDVRTGVEAVAIDRERRQVVVSDGEPIGYDRLVVATGAEPLRPELDGIQLDGILGVQSLADGQRVIDAMVQQPRHVVVVGSGYIGLEMAEACVAQGFDTTVVEQADSPMPLLDPVLGDLVADAMRARGIELRTSAAVAGFEGTDGRVTGVRVGDEVLPADLVILGLGVRARSDLAERAGLPLGVKGSIVVDGHQRVDGTDDVWAVGDCSQTVDRTTGSRVHVPLGTHANKQGMVAAHAIAADLLGGEPPMSFPGIVQTAITKFCSLEISRAGLAEHQARDAGLDPVVATIETTTIAGYMPGAGPMTVWLAADRATRRLVGAQIVGAENAGLRIDVAATAISAGMTVDDVVMLDLAYAPPFGSVWSPVQVAARAVAKRLDA